MCCQPRADQYSFSKTLKHHTLDINSLNTQKVAATKTQYMWNECDVKTQIPNHLTEEFQRLSNKSVINNTNVKINS